MRIKLIECLKRQFKDIYIQLFNNTEKFSELKMYAWFCGMKESYQRYEDMYKNSKCRENRRKTAIYLQG